MIKIADKDGSGVVEFQEFMEMICDQVEVKIVINVVFKFIGKRKKDMMH